MGSDASLEHVREVLHRSGWWPWHSMSGVGVDGPFVELLPSAPPEVVAGVRAVALPLGVAVTSGASSFGWS